MHSIISARRNQTLRTPGGVLVELSYDDAIIEIDPDTVSLTSQTVQVAVTGIGAGETDVTATSMGFVDGTTHYVVEEAELVPGDVDADGCVNVADLLTVRNNLGNSGSDIFPPAADVSPADPDGVVNVADLLFVRNRLGDGDCPQ